MNSIGPDEMSKETQNHNIITIVGSCDIGVLPRTTTYTLHTHTQGVDDLIKSSYDIIEPHGLQVSLFYFFFLIYQNCLYYCNEDEFSKC